MDVKVCAKCRQEKEINEFSKNKARPDGYDTYCRDCRLEYNKQQQQKHKVIEKVEKEKEEEEEEAFVLDKENKLTTARYSERINKKTAGLIQEEDEVLDEAERTVKKRHEDDIIKGYWEKAVLPCFDRGDWLTRATHETEINELIAKHGYELSRQKNNYEQKMQELQVSNQQLIDANNGLINDNIGRQAYIDNNLDDAGRREASICRGTLERLARERMNFVAEKERIDAAHCERERKQDEREKQLDEHEKQVLADIEKNKKILYNINTQKLENKKILEQIISENNKLQQKENDAGLKHKQRMSELNGKLEQIRVEKQNLRITKDELYQIRMSRSSKRIEDSLK